jgi:hypothetical protein
MTTPGVELELAHRGSGDRLPVLVEVLERIHDVGVFTTEALDDERRRAVHPHRRPEREEVATPAGG